MYSINCTCTTILTSRIRDLTRFQRPGIQQIQIPTARFQPRVVSNQYIVNKATAHLLLILESVSVCATNTEIVDFLQKSIVFHITTHSIKSSSTLKRSEINLQVFTLKHLAKNFAGRRGTFCTSYSMSSKSWEYFEVPKLRLS